MEIKDLIEWLETQNGASLISDDNGHWDCVFDGFQNIPMDDGPCDIQTTFFIKKEEWKNTIKEAIEWAKNYESRE